MQASGTLGMRLRNMRIERGLAQETVAAAVGVRTLSYGRWERDQQLPGLANRLALARFFAVEPAAFVDEDPVGAMAASALPAGTIEHDQVERMAALEARMESLEATMMRCEHMLARITKAMSNAG